MRGYLAELGAESGRLLVNRRIELYRDDESYNVYARTADGEYEISIRDATVSKPHNGIPPAVIEP
jgi:hypothetical protein